MKEILQNIIEDRHIIYFVIGFLIYLTGGFKKL